jgi:hypothetical protein
MMNSVDYMITASMHKDEIVIRLKPLQPPRTLKLIDSEEDSVYTWFQARIANALVNNDIRTMTELSSIHPKLYDELRGVGDSGVQGIYHALEAYRKKYA